MVLEREFPEDERVSKEIQTLQKNGHQVSLACFTKQNRSIKEVINEVEIFRKPISIFIDKTSVGALKFPFYFNFWSRFLQRIFQKNIFDAIHVHDLPLARVGYKLCKKYNMKFVLDLHENWPVLLDLSPHTKSFLGRILSNNKQWLKYEQKFASIADGLVVVANEMKERLIAKGVSNANIAVVPNTSNVNIFDKYKESKPDPDYITLYYAGGINKHRGLEIVIKGLSKIDLPNNFRFWIIGKGKNQSFLKELVNNLALNKHIRFLGWKSHDDVLKYLSESDIAVIPHLRNEHTDNTSPNKIFHYMLAKKPILSSNCVYLKNIIESSRAGIVYSDIDSNEFSNKLSYLLQNKETWKEFGENGLKAVVNQYNWENTSKPLIDLYKEF